MSDRVQAAMQPVISEDLANYIIGLCQPFIQVESLARDDDDGNPGWSIILDLDRCPVEGLPWLAQLNGTVLNTSLSESDQRAQILAAVGQKRGRPATIAAAIAPYLSGTKTVIMKERDPIACPTIPAYGLSVYTYRDETNPTDLDTTNLCDNGGFEINSTKWTYVGAAGGSIVRDNHNQKFGSIALALITAGGINDSASYDSTTNDYNPGDVVTVSAYIKSSSPGLLQNLQTNELDVSGAQLRFTSWPNVVTTGDWQRMTATMTLGASTRRLQLYITEGAVQSIHTLWIDGVQMEKNPVATPYVDTNGTIASRALATGPLGAALRAAKPAGIILNYNAVDRGTYASLLASEASYSHILADYKTYEGVLTGTLGA
jgi:hypothetical protein